MKRIVIIGSGGFAREVAFLIENINRTNPTWKFDGYIVESAQEIGEFNGKYKIFNTDDWLLSTEDEIYAVIAIGNPVIIQKVAEKFKKNENIMFPNLIHPNVIADWDRISLGEGNIICAGNILTTDINIGSFNIFNLGCTVGHDSLIGNSNVFNPSVNISGGVKIRNGNLIGTGAQVLQYLTISDSVTVGAGAVVTKNLPEPGVYVGLPAKKLG